MAPLVRDFRRIGEYSHRGYRYIRRCHHKPISPNTVWGQPQPANGGGNTVGKILAGVGLGVAGTLLLGKLSHHKSAPAGQGQPQKGFMNKVLSFFGLGNKKTTKQPEQHIPASAPQGKASGNPNANLSTEIDGLRQRSSDRIQKSEYLTSQDSAEFEPQIDAAKTPEELAGVAKNIMAREKQRKSEQDNQNGGGTPKVQELPYTPSSSDGQNAPNKVICA